MRPIKFGVSSSGLPIFKIMVAFCHVLLLIVSPISSCRQESGAKPGSKQLFEQQPNPNGPFSCADLIVSPIVVGNLPEYFIGFSYEKSTINKGLFSGSNYSLARLFNLVGPGILRIGGNSVDQAYWKPFGIGQTGGQIAPPDIDSLADFLAMVPKWRVIYGVNLGGDAKKKQSPGLAASEVLYVSKKIGSALTGIEIGNECDAYGGNGGYFAGNWSLPVFTTLWKSYHDSIVVQSPDISFTGPATASALKITSWTIPFGEIVTKRNISLLTQHYYRTSGQSSQATSDYLLSPNQAIAKVCSQMKSGALAIGVPFRISECNSFSNGGAPGVSNSYTSSLWVIDFMFQCAIGSASGINLHGGGNSSYAPLEDNGKAVLNVRPEFYGLKLFSDAGTGAVLQTKINGDSAQVTAYTVQHTDGTYSVIVVNKDSLENLQCTLTLPHILRKAVLTQMTQLSPANLNPSLSALNGVQIQLANIDNDGNFSPSNPYNLKVSNNQIFCYVPLLSAVRIDIE